MRLSDCHNFHDFRELARRRLPRPIFDYIDGAADDELTLRQNTASFERCDLVPNVLRGVNDVDLSVTVMGQRLAMPVYCSPTALQRLFHHRGEHAVAAAASKYGTMFGVSSLGTVSLEELRARHATPQVYQFYFHKDRSLNRAMLDRAKQAGVDVMMLTVDSITGGNRERDLRSGFSIPFRLTPGAVFQFAVKPAWGVNYLLHERFRLPQLDQHIDMGRGALSIGRYFTEMLDASMNWSDVESMVGAWNGQFCLKGVMSVADAKRAVEIGCTGIVLSNHGGRQLDGSRAAVRPAGRRRRCRRGPAGRDDGWRRPARHPRPEGPVTRREGGRCRPLLSVSPGGCRSGGCRKGAGPDAFRNRARDEVDGLRLDRRVVTGKHPLQVVAGRVRAAHPCPVRGGFGHSPTAARCHRVPAVTGACVGNSAQLPMAVAMIPVTMTEVILGSQSPLPPCLRRERRRQSPMLATLSRGRHRPWPRRIGVPASAAIGFAAEAPFYGR
jgi:L-lactate dehydrogenase (cytochrome)